MTTFPSTKIKGNRAPRKIRWMKGTANNPGTAYGAVDNVPANAGGASKSRLDKQVSRYGAKL